MTNSDPPPQEKKALGLRLAMAAAILLAEYLSLSFLFDAQTAASRGGAWTWIAGAGSVGPLIVVAGAAILLVPKARWGMKEAARARTRPVLLTVHVALAGSFFLLTRELFGATDAPDGSLALWLGAWLLTGLLSPLALFLGAIGDARWVFGALLRALTVGGVVGLLAFWGGLLSKSAWHATSAATFRTVHAMLSLAGFSLEAYPDERILALENFRIHVAPVCSGIEGLGLFLVLILGFLFQFRRSLRFPQAWLLVPIGMAVIWLGNSLRISALMVLGARVDPELAIGSFHSKAGWVVFCAITILITQLARRSAFFSKQEETSEAEGSPATPFLLPLLCWIGIGMVTSSFATAHDPYYGLRVVACAALLFSFRGAYRDLLAWPSWPAWVVGILVGVAWLAIPTSAERAIPGEDWSDLTYFSWLWMRVIGTVLIIPLCEELGFRGFLARFLVSRDFNTVRYRDLTWLAIGISSLAFGLLHGRIILATATGVLYALVLRRSGKLIDPIAAHAASNALIAAYVLWTGHWEHF